jgi:nitrogen fixation protein NifU and related proteins
MDVRELYQEVILDHSKRPRNFGTLAGARQADGANPLCGDQLTVYLIVDGDVIRDVRFEGSGCAISTASASLMTEAVKGKRVTDTLELFEQFHDVVTSSPADDITTAGIGKLAALAGVREFPMRVKCASLAWHTLRAALNDRTERVTTE